MRHFPRTTRGSRLLAGALSGTLALGVLAVGTAAVPHVTTAAVAASPFAQGDADDLKKKKRTVERRIEQAETDLHASSTRMQRAASALASAREQLGVAQVTLAAAEAKVATAEERDARMQVELDAATAELEAAQAELAAGQAQRATQRGQVAATIADMYQQGDPELLAFASLLDARTPADLTRQTEMRDAIVDREARVYQELQASEVLLEVHEARVAEAKAQVEVKRQAAADHLVEMQGYRAEALAAKEAVAALVGERRTAQVEAAAARRADQAELAKLEAEEKALADKLRRLALEALRAQRARARAQAGPPGNSGGFLDAPVGGVLSSPFGFRTHPIYGYWGLHDGQDWAADCGTPLYAGANGRVVSSYTSAVYGRRLVLDHGVVAGRGLATVYNHASSYTVGPGASVQRGQVIGYVGDTGWSTGCHLHFTVMANGRAVDPRGWL
ncbi:M23 family metallopeptidase [Nocardioides solisilvae]|uniref:M23 family metallopeptidase n=1 Tax=Nocardioides solisilvae TaxID=1542435 RepID=UPI000D746ACA|nr:M23 family metallopeptidase [Nocardioides solisilvae]